MPFATFLTFARATRAARLAATTATAVAATVTATAVVAVVAVGASAHASPESLTRDAPQAAADADPTTIVCPVPAGSEFSDSWGAARSGGRRHQGVDMVADRGSPVVAVQSGEATFKRSRLGGNAVWLYSTSGNEFYYAHLDAFEGSSRTVEAGEVIGYVGSSGNAKGPHLHFETHFEGSVSNPYPATADACAARFDVADTHADALATLRRGAVNTAVPVGPALVTLRIK